MCTYRDAAALTEFWAWLEEEVLKATVTEVQVADKLLEFRSKQSGFLDTSFDTISGMLLPYSLRCYSSAGLHFCSLL